jgi:uncharacterized protein (DUF1330 family)
VQEPRLKGRVLAVYTSFKLLEGKGPVVAIEFPDMEAARRWYENAAYQAVQRHPELTP